MNYRSCCLTQRSRRGSELQQGNLRCAGFNPEKVRTYLKPLSATSCRQVPSTRMNDGFWRDVIRGGVWGGGRGVVPCKQRPSRRIKKTQEEEERERGQHQPSVRPAPSLRISRESLVEGSEDPVAVDPAAPPLSG